MSSGLNAKGKTVTKKRGKGSSILKQSGSYYLCLLITVSILSPAVYLVLGAVVMARWPVACAVALCIGEIGRRLHKFHNNRREQNV